MSDDVLARTKTALAALNSSTYGGDGFSGAANEAMKSARRAMDSTSDRATVVAVSVPCA